MGAHFAIEAYDENQQRRLCGGDAFYCTVEPAPGNSSADAAPISAAVTDKGDGIYAVEYTVLTSGEYDGESLTFPFSSINWRRPLTNTHVSSSSSIFLSLSLSRNDGV